MLVDVPPCYVIQVSLRPKDGTNPYLRGVALDPENKYAAMATADGCVLVFELLEGQESKQECRKTIAAKVLSLQGGGGGKKSRSCLEGVW